MGKVVEKKKKKGRPSLLDLQKRSLKLQQQQIQSQNQHLIQKRNPNPSFRNPNPTSNSITPQRRSTRRNPNPGANADSGQLENDDAEDSDDDENSTGKRKEKKLKLVLKLPPRSVNSPSPQHHHQLRSTRSDGGPYGSDSNGEDENGEETPLKKRKINAVVGDGSAEEKAERFKHGTKATGSTPGAPLGSGPTTPLPDKMLLVFILDRLQKKDTYGVFSEPVDPKELPDYHEVIEHPMDFGTVKKKLSGGVYASLEQFEKDVFLICSNAMRYNAPDTVYFRQARSIQELARKSFENLRQDEDNEPELKTAVRRGRPPGKSSAKRPVDRPPLERAGSDFSSDATLANAGESAGWSNSAHDTLRKFAGSTDLSTRNSLGIRSGETSGWLMEHRSERNDEFAGLKGLSKVGKKQFVFDENRRSTYNQSLQSISGREPTVLTTFDGERKQLISVGLHMEHAYARSLARFAANIGPVAWKVASKRIERALAPGLKFGPGWVGEHEAPRQQLPLLSSPARLPLPSPPQPLQSSSQPRLSPCTTIPRTLESKSEKPSEKQEPSNNSSLGGSSRTPPSTTTSSVANRSSDTVDGSETIRGTNHGSGFSFGMRPKAHFQLNQNPTMQPPTNGFNSGCGFNLAAQVGKFMRPPGAVGNLSSQPSTPQMIDMASRRNNTFVQHSMPTNRMEAEGAKLLGSSNSVSSDNSMPDSSHVGQPGCRPGLQQQPSWRSLSLHQKPDSVPPDLNVRFQSPGSPASGVLVDSQQPDLALQL